MKNKILRHAVLAAFALAAFGTLAGCGKAEQAMKKADVGTTTALTSLVANAAKTLGGIKDVESARNALPMLKEMNLDLDGIVAKVKEMSPEQKSQMTAAVSKAMPQLESAIEKATSLNGVGAVVGPTLASFQNKFKSMM